MIKLYRSIARSRMQKAGIKHINRSIIRMTEIGLVNIGSIFSRYWKNYCLAPAPKKED